MGWPSVAWGLEHISSQELAEWLAYASIEPFGGVRSDLQAGIVAATVANSQRNPDTKSAPYLATDFMPDFERVAAEEERQSWEQQLALVTMINAAYGGPELVKGGDPS